MVTFPHLKVNIFLVHRGSPWSVTIDPGREGTPSRQPILLSPSQSHLDSLRKSTEESRLFTRANLVLRPALLRWGWVLLKRTRILSGIQLTAYFIEIFVVETKRFVSSFVNVTLTRQTCGQRSSRAAESKRRAIGNYFSTDKSFRFHNKNFDEIRCKLYSTENPRSFEKYPTPPQIDFFIWEKIAMDLIDFWRFFAIFCDFFLGNQIRHREKTEEDCKDLLPSLFPF